MMRFVLLLYNSLWVTHRKWEGGRSGKRQNLSQIFSVAYYATEKAVYKFGHILC